MVNFKIKILDESVVLDDVVNVIYKVSANSDLSDPILDITQTADISVLNVLELTSDVELINGVTYYAIASYVTRTGGLSYTSNVTELVGGNTLDIELEFYLPSITPIPKITSVYPKTSFPNKGFIARIDYPDTVLNKHYATTWHLIRLIDNVIVDSSILDINNIHSMVFTKELLPGIYEIRARRHMVSGNDSVYGVFTFTVRPRANIMLKYKLAIDVMGMVYAKEEIDKLSVISDTDDLHMKIFSNDILVSEMDIDAGITDVELFTNTTIQIYINGIPESSIYVYSLNRYPGSCRFDYILPVDFC